MYELLFARADTSWRQRIAPLQLRRYRLDRLQVLHAHNVTELPGVHDLFDRAPVRRVLQHAPDSEHDPRLLIALLPVTLARMYPRASGALRLADRNAYGGSA
jgi:hypothetical protein